MQKVKTPRNLRHIIKHEFTTPYQIREVRWQIQDRPGDPLQEHGPWAVFERARKCRKIVMAESFVELISNLAGKGVKAAQWLLRAIMIARYSNPDPIGNYWAFREKEGMVSYCPAGRIQKLNEFGFWQRDGRQAMKPGKFIRAFLNPVVLKRLSDEDVAEFSAEFKAAQADMQWIVGRETIESAYTGEIPFVSCMQDRPVADFYNKIGVTECITVRNKKGRLLGRALIWQDESLFGGRCHGLVDRIYGSPEIVATIKNWAKSNGFAYKKEQNGGCWEYVLPSETYFENVLTWKADFPNCDYVPYMDTFCVYTNGAFYAGNPEKISRDGDYILRDTTGRYIFRGNRGN